MSRPPSLRIRFHAARSNLAPIRRFVRSLITGAPGALFTPEDADEITLALQECLSNTMRHAYPCPGRAPVELRMQVREGCFEARIKDWGRPFDPTRAPDPEPGRPRDGGFGLYLVRRLMDEVRYRRVGRVNVLDLARGAFHPSRSGRHGVKSGAPASR